MDSHRFVIAHRWTTSLVDIRIASLNTLHMNLLAETRQLIIKKLWQTYLQNIVPAQQIHSLTKQNTYLDHFAIIDLPGPNSGIAQLKQIFTLLGFRESGCGYLEEKQNDFIWLSEETCENKIAVDVLPQIVLADFRLNELPSTVQNIIQKYTQHTPPLPLSEIETLCHAVNNGDKTAQSLLVVTIINLFNGRAWPTPSIEDYRTVKATNELLSWVLIFGRQANHFGLSIHLMPEFNNLKEFNDFIKNKLGVQFNNRDLEIKGSKQLGIEQSSTSDHLIKVVLEDGEIEIPSPFMEFVWRYPKIPNTPAILWKDYYTDFYAPNANRVIESVYE